VLEQLDVLYMCVTKLTLSGSPNVASTGLHPTAIKEIRAKDVCVKVIVVVWVCKYNCCKTFKSIL